jgi:hypothetical protein
LQVRTGTGIQIPEVAWAGPCADVAGRSTAARKFVARQRAGTAQAQRRTIATHAVSAEIPCAEIAWHRSGHAAVHTTHAAGAIHILHAATHATWASLRHLHVGPTGIAKRGAGLWHLHAVSAHIHRTCRAHATHVPQTTPWASTKAATTHRRASTATAAAAHASTTALCGGFLDRAEQIHRSNDGDCREQPAHHKEFRESFHKVPTDLGRTLRR